MVRLSASVLDSVFHALAHPARRLILRSLADGERNLTELATPLKMSFPAASKHVRVLEQAKLVRRRLVGRTHICSINTKPLVQVTEWLEHYRSIWESSFQRMDNILMQMKAQDLPEASILPNLSAKKDRNEEST